MRLTSKMLFDKANQCIPGGVNSPVRAFKGVGGTPIFIQKGLGANIWDVENNSYIDYVGSWGPMILGHNHPAVKAAVLQALDNGLSFGAPTEIEVLMAEKITNLMPSIESIRMVNSGTEACMSALRLARGYTKRNKIIKFDGCYHGHCDSLLVKAGSGLLTLSHPSSAGVTKDTSKDTLIAQFNDLDSVQALFEANHDDIAAVIIEPIAANMNLVLPNTQFLTGLREICDKFKACLIYDEVITGFRVGLGGAQALYNIKPDLTCLGKIIGGGMPVGAFGGKREIMDCLAPIGSVYQAGTLSGNPIAMTAGLATLQVLQTPGSYETLKEMTDYLISGLNECARAYNIPFHATSITGLFGLHFGDNLALFQNFYHKMLVKGCYFAPSMYESGFMSLAHTKDMLNFTIEAAASVFGTLNEKYGRTPT